MTSGLHGRRLFVHEPAHLGGRRRRHRRIRPAAALPPVRGARRWGLPGGRLRHDESPADAVVRAVRAETGWAVAPADLVGLYRVTDPQVPAPPAGRCGGRPDVLVHVFRAGPADAGPAGEPATGCLPRWWPP
ncbi:NUDIX hydrolase [Micromonospora sp. BRA006-A]|nr:NUDIX hydrolase [Micromonospora sp. BRA006-A]